MRHPGSDVNEVTSGPSDLRRVVVPGDDQDATSTIVDGAGCSAQQADTDSDGVLNDNDLCPSSPLGEKVDADGCKLVEVESISEDSESSLGINQVLILIALVLAGVAGYMTFKPVKAPVVSPQKTIPPVATEPERVEEVPTIVEENQA